MKIPLTNLPEGLFQVILVYEINLRELFLLPASSQEELSDFFGDSRHKCEPHHHTPFTSAEEVGVEDGLEERHGAYQHHQGD
jgi:hypothetical protein